MNTASTAKVRYDYANGSVNTVRPSSVTCSNASDIEYNYGAASSLPDALSRPAAVIDTPGDHFAVLDKET